MTSNDPAATTPEPVRDLKTAPGGASCGVRDPYPALAPKGARASRSAADPGGPAAEREAGPGVPTTQGNDTTPTAAATIAPRRRRLRQSVPRLNRVCPRFSDSEWTAVRTAAETTELEPGGYAAAAVLATAASNNPTAAIADYRRGVQELMESNRQLAAIGNNLNQIAHYLNAGGQPAADLQQLLHRVDDAITTVDEAVTWLVRR